MNYLLGLAPGYVDIAGSYRRSQLAANRSKATIDTSMWALSKLGRYLEKEGLPVDVNALKKQHIEGLMEGMLVGSGLSLSTAATAFRYLRAFFNWCVEEELIKRSPMVA
ncbi:MAG TPA: phage integrase N-terminal SAM-like domain-containing protein [Chloroflexia bacterium]|nr:phage integrase N-terminal SAM-like domain-containing protein [Chloroflexia bacterium]